MVEAILDSSPVKVAAIKPAYSNLLQELTYALAGITGDVFVDMVETGVENQAIRSASRSTFSINPEADWLSDCDQKQIEGILSLGYHYHEIDRFAQQLPNSQRLCWQGLRVGLEELCVVYQAALLRVERHILADSTSTITSIQHYLSEYAAILPGVHRILHEIANLPNRTDAAVMNLLYDRAHCGKPSLEAVLERLLWNCNQVLYRHLSAWLFHGVLLETGFNFFITQSNPSQPQAHTDSGRTAYQHMDDDDHPVATSWSSFKLQLAYVPKYLPAASAQNILDIGRAVRLLCRPPEGPTSGPPTAPTSTQPSADSVAMSSRMRRQRSSTVGPTDSGARRPEMDLDLSTLSAAFHRLAAMPKFSGIVFQATISELHEQVSKEVCSLVVDHAALTSHLFAIKDFLLLGRGDVFWMFLDASASMLRRPPDASTATPNLQRAFLSAAARTGVDSMPEFVRVSISWNPEPAKLPIGKSMHAHIPCYFQARQGAQSWNDVSLSYTPPWPLPLLLTRDALDVYEGLFRYLLAVERACRALDEVWQHVMTHMRSSRRRWVAQAGGEGSRDAQSRLQDGGRGALGGGAGGAGGQACTAAILRHRMDCVVRHLRGYLEEVLSRLFAEVAEGIESAKTFVDVQRAHEELLENLKLQTFLTSRSTCELIENVLQGCRMLCMAVTEGETELSLHDISERFDANSYALLEQLASLHMESRYTGGHRISHLLLHLDFQGQRTLF